MTERASSGWKQWPYSMKLLPVGDLFVDARYQRPVTTIADEIAERFNRLLLDPLLVSARDGGKYAIVDGQNRWEGGRRIGESYLPCRVIDLRDETDPVQHEAQLFADLQRMRRNIKPLETFKAERFAGNVNAVAVGRVLDARSIKLGGSGPDALSAISYARDIERRWGQKALEETLDTIIAVWPAASGRFAGDVLLGLAAFLYLTRPDADRGRLVDRMVAAWDKPAGLKEAAAGLKVGGVGSGGRSSGYARQAIELVYDNPRARAKR